MDDLEALTVWVSWIKDSELVVLLGMLRKSKEVEALKPLSEIRRLTCLSAQK